MAAPHQKGNAEQISKAIDLNGDGSLTKDEFCSGKGMGRARVKAWAKEWVREQANRRYDLRRGRL